MLIDSSHTRWIVGTAVVGVLALGFHLFWGWSVPGGLTGGSTVGLWYGAIGTALMVYAGLLAAHRKFPSTWHWWIVGPRKRWLRGHIWLGLLSVVFILCHSGYRWGGGLELTLWIVFLVTIISGVLGLLAQAYLPHQITNRIGAETPFEQIPHVCEVMRRQADDLVDAVLANKDTDQAIKDHLNVFYSKSVRPFLGPTYESSSPLSRALQAELLFDRVRAEPGMTLVAPVLARLAAFCEERRQIGQQERLHWLLHGWLLVHVPITLALLVLGAAHIFMSLYY